MTPPPTPELDKLELVWPKAIVIMEFLNWLQKEYTVCDGHYYRTQFDHNRLLSEYFKLDLPKLESERKAILESLKP